MTDSSSYRGESVHPGSFIRAATEGGGDEPLLTVAYVKKMRTIVPVPDNQVPYCHVGDPATVTLDALAGREFKGAISRVAESEDLNDRTMRVEIDLDNPDGVLRDGMFGRATILLEKVIKNLTIPSSCFVKRNGKGEGEIMVVRDGKVHRVNVHVGMDTGLRSEIIDGLKDEDLVVLQPDASVADGTAVDPEIVSPNLEKDAVEGLWMTRSSRRDGDAMQSQATSCRIGKGSVACASLPVIAVTEDRRCRESPRVAAGRSSNRLERRLQLSLTPPANSIGTAVGDVTAPGEVAETSVTVAPKNLTTGKVVDAFRRFRSARGR